MTLEDFFTLTEMKNGLTTLVRVEELISTMQQQDCAVTNVGDAVRQWSTVASTLAATESKDCLHHFVELNGPCFLKQWLEETLKYSNDIADSTVEDSIHALLGSLEKIYREHSFTSGIHTTIDKLLQFKVINGERARVLYERWKQAGEDDVVKPKCSANGEAVDSANSTCLDFDNTTYRERTSRGNCRTESNVTVDEEAARADNINDVLPVTEWSMISTSSITADANANTNLVDRNALMSSLPSGSCQENISRTEESSVGPAAEITSSGTWNCSDATGSHVDEKTCDASTLDDDDAAKEMKMDVDTKEDSSQVLPSSSSNFDSKENKYHVSETIETLPKQQSELGKEDTIETPFQKKLAVESDSEADLVVSRIDTSDVLNSSKMGKINQISEYGLEDGELDALEVARQVAVEVEREVVDYREPFCSSSPEGSSGEVVFPQKSSLIAEKSEQDQPASHTSPNEEPDTCQDGMPNQEEDACGSIGKSDRERLDFDLNEDVRDEEDYTVSPPIAVAASKGAPLLPVAPICFKGGHGWKGSAATSAFHSASQRTTLAGQKRKSNLIEIDLNVMDSGVDVDSMEVGSRRANRLKLDLNHPAEDDGDADQMGKVSCWRLPRSNSAQTMSPTSSSSLRRHRDFDLNDNPSFFDTMVDSKLDVSAVTIMGTRMVVERRDCLTATMSSRPVLPYAHIPLSTYGYNGPMMRPGSFPYPTDSRGMTGGVNTAPASTRSFLDLNTGLPTVDSGNQDCSYSGLFNL